MPITPRNFCHIETIEDGIQVLFYVEHEGDNIKLHQVVICNMGTADIAVTMPSEKWEELWPDSVRFEDAAAKTVQSVRDMGFHFNEEAFDG